MSEKKYCEMPNCRVVVVVLEKGSKVKKGTTFYCESCQNTIVSTMRILKEGNKKKNPMDFGNLFGDIFSK